MRSLFQTYVHGSISAVLGPFRRYLPAVVLLGLLATALEGIGIGLVIPLLDVVVSGGSDAQGFLPGLADGTALLKPCEMPQDKVVAFVMDLVAD